MAGKLLSDRARGLASLTDERIAAIRDTHERWLAASIERGRRLVMAGNIDTPRQPEQLEILDYWMRERERVERSGHCSDGCNAGNLTRNNWTGELVCMHTWRPCPRRRLSLILEQFRKGFQRDE